MGRKTIILREDQFNEICGTNTAYLDNDNDYKQDGTLTTKAAGAVSDSNGEKRYSEPITGDEWSDEMTPETLWHILFSNGGHGLLGHWGSGMRPYMVNESNSELEGHNFNGASYTKWTTDKSKYKDELEKDRLNNASPEKIANDLSAFNTADKILKAQTGPIKQRKENMMKLGMANQFQKPGGHKNSGNGKRHSSKITEVPNVGTGVISYNNE